MKGRVEVERSRTETFEFSVQVEDCNCAADPRCVVWPNSVAVKLSEPLRSEMKIVMAKKHRAKFVACGNPRKFCVVDAKAHFIEVSKSMFRTNPNSIVLSHRTFGTADICSESFMSKASHSFSEKK